jgi:glutamine amidotransferase-like uncharacterized protein
MHASLHAHGESACVCVCDDVYLGCNRFKFESPFTRNVVSLRTLPESVDFSHSLP